MIKELKNKINSYLLFDEELTKEDFTDMLDLLEEQEDFEKLLVEVVKCVKKETITVELEELSDKLHDKYYWTVYRYKNK